MPKSPRERLLARVPPPGVPPPAPDPRVYAQQVTIKLTCDRCSKPTAVMKRISLKLDRPHSVVIYGYARVGASVRRSRDGWVVACLAGHGPRGRGHPRYLVGVRLRTALTVYDAAVAAGTTSLTLSSLR